MDRDLLKRTIWTGLACAALIAALFLWVDRPVDHAARQLEGGFWFQAATLLSLFANHDFFNVLLFLCFIYAGVGALSRGLTPGTRLMLYCCLAVCVTMLLGETLKWIMGRYRPVMLFEHHLYGFSFFASEGNLHSFPSGHTFRIFSAMTALFLVFPKARLWFFGLAGLVGISRVLVTRHFPGDVVAGAFLGVFCALWVWRIMQGPKDEPGSEPAPAGN